MICGIYKIENIINHKVYVGSSNHIYNRWAGHKTLLKQNKHGNKHLQLSYNKYGSESFVYSIIEECDQDTLINREQYWYDHYNNIVKMYNKGMFVECPARGRIVSDVTKKKLSDINKGKRLTEETKLKMSKSRMGKGSWCYGKKFTTDHRMNLSKAKKGKPLSDAQRLSVKKLAEYNTGKHHSIETKLKLSIANKGKHSNDRKGVTPWNKGIHSITPEHKEKLRIANTGRKCSEETKRKIGLKNRKYA